MFGLFAPAAPPEKTPIQLCNELVYKTRVKYEKGLRQALAAKHGDMTNEIASLVANYIFDFGDFGFQIGAGLEIKQPVGEALLLVCHYDIEDRHILTKVLIHRCLQLKLPHDKFVSHMHDLWVLCITPIGPFVHTKDYIIPQHRPLLDRLLAMEPTPQEIYNCLEPWQDEDFVGGAKGWFNEKKIPFRPPEKEKPAEAEAPAPADAAEGDGAAAAPAAAGAKPASAAAKPAAAPAKPAGVPVKTVAKPAAPGAAKPAAVAAKPGAVPAKPVAKPVAKPAAK